MFRIVGSDFALEGMVCDEARDRVIDGLWAVDGVLAFEFTAMGNRACVEGAFGRRAAWAKAARFCVDSDLIEDV